MIKVIVAGAAGRMGCRLVSLVRDSTALMLTGALEGNGHPALGEDAGETAGSGHAGLPITDDLSILMERGEVVIDGGHDAGETGEEASGRHQVGEQVDAPGSRARRAVFFGRHRADVKLFG